VKTIHTDTDHFRIEIPEALQLSFVGRQLRRADTTKSERHKCQHNILLPAQIAEMPRLTLISIQRKIGSSIANLQRFRLATISTIHNVIILQLRQKQKPAHAPLGLIEKD
jgi:hypothetical protein